LAKALLRDCPIKSWFIFPPHVNGVSALLGETQTTENASFQLNTVSCFARKHAQHIETITRSHSKYIALPAGLPSGLN